MLADARVVEAVAVFDRRPVRRTDPEREARSLERRRDRGRPIGLQHRVARVRLEHRRTQLDLLGRLARERDDRHRVERDRACVPKRREPVAFRGLGLVDDPLRCR